jgi:hypothetical protein
MSMWVEGEVCIADTFRDTLQRAIEHIVSRFYHAAIFGLAGILLVIAAVSPWLMDPLEGNKPAWALPVNIGWQFPPELEFLVNYGMLCMCCAAVCFVLSWRSYKKRGQINVITRVWLLCLLPLMLFVLQYLCIDMEAINRLAQHQLQWLLIIRHFGYRVAPLRITIKPFDIDASTIQGRMILLVQQISFGALLPCLSALVTVLGKLHPVGMSPTEYMEKPAAALFPLSRHKAPTLAPQLPPVSGRPAHRPLLLIGGIFLLILLGRAPLGLLCQDEASNLLTSGNYSSALSWLHVAAFLNTSLAQVDWYHIDRGQALYYLNGDEQSDDSRVYLASTYGQLNDDLSAYEQLFSIWQAHQDLPWVQDELNITLAKLAEFTHPINGPLLERPINDPGSLSWLEILARVNSTNVYAQYTIGRIQYDLHNYAVSIAQMKMVIALSRNNDLLSSAYTYLALCADGQQRFTDERNLLYQAISLDSGYHNNTAREALSGLH